jgi:hypothetical protein
MKLKVASENRPHAAIKGQFVESSRVFEWPQGRKGTGRFGLETRQNGSLNATRERKSH